MLVSRLVQAPSVVAIPSQVAERTNRFVKLMPLMRVGSKTMKMHTSARSDTGDLVRQNGSSKAIEGVLFALFALGCPGKLFVYLYLIDPKGM